MDEVKTGVDEFMDLVRREIKISIPDAAKKLRTTEKIVQNWADFLVEEKLLGIEYKFTTPFVYINSPSKSSPLAKQKSESMEDIRTQFILRAKEKGIPADKLSALWANHLQEALENKYPFFVQECQKRNVKPERIQLLFDRYKEKILKTYELGTTA